MHLKFVLSQAKNLGYSHQNRSPEDCRIFSLRGDESWTLTYNYVDFRWILAVNEIPQLILIDAEAIDFLKKRASLCSCK